MSGCWYVADKGQETVREAVRFSMLASSSHGLRNSINANRMLPFASTSVRLCNGMDDRPLTLIRHTNCTEPPVATH